MRCAECLSRFYGRADARYCSGACRQKAYRRRAQSAPKPALADVVADARRNQEHARDVREQAKAARRGSAEAVRRSLVIRAESRSGRSNPRQG